MITRCGSLVAWGALAACAAAQTQTQPAPPPQTAPTPPTTAPALDPEVDKILTRLETREVRDLRAKLAWAVQYVEALPGDETMTKRGEIWYQQAQPVAKFLVKFDQSITGNRRDAGFDERHMFDGRWYTELNSRTKMLTRREIRGPGDVGNPYKLGEGPFPVPFGQKRADILREFDVARLEVQPGDPPGTDRIKLTPRAGTRTGEAYKELEFWVAREGAVSGLPIRVRVAKRDGTGKVNSYITITFDDVQLNTGFDRNLFNIEKPAGYELVEEPLKPAELPGGADAGKK